MYQNNRSTSLKHRKRLNYYTNSTGTCKFDPKTEEAYSYGWWCFVKRIKGKLVFNNYSYSSSTSNHQSAVLELLSTLRIKVDLTVNVQGGLQKLKDQSLEPVYEKLFELELFGKRKRSIKNLGASIKSVRSEIKLLRSLGAVFTRKQQAELKQSMIETDKVRREQQRAEAAVRREQKRAKAASLASMKPVNMLARELESKESINF